MEEFKITKAECNQNINKRMPVVCCSCGGSIEPIETIDNSGAPTHWAGCMSCGYFDNGTTPEIYLTAVKMVDERHFRPYRDMEPEKNSAQYDYWRKSQIRGAVSVVADVLWLYNSIAA